MLRCEGSESHSYGVTGGVQGNRANTRGGDDGNVVYLKPVHDSDVDALLLTKLLWCLCMTVTLTRSFLHLKLVHDSDVDVGVCEKSVMGFQLRAFRCCWFTASRFPNMPNEWQEAVTTECFGSQGPAVNVTANAVAKT